MRLILSTITTAALFLAACGGDSGSDSTTDSTAVSSPTEQSATATTAAPANSTATSTAPPASNATTQPPASTDGSSDVMAIAQTALLQSGDFPAEWTSEPQDPDDSDADRYNDIFTGECAAYSYDTFPGDLADAESDDFKGPSHQTVSSDATVFDSDASATSAFDMSANMPDECMYQFEQGLTRVFKDSFTEDGIDPSAEVIVTIDRMPWPLVGDGVTAFRAVWTLETSDMAIGGGIDMITWREGRMLAGITYSSYMAPSLAAQVARNSEIAADESRLVQILAERTARANAALS